MIQHYIAITLNFKHLAYTIPQQWYNTTTTNNNAQILFQENTVLHFTFFPSQIVISTFLSNAKKNYTFPLAAVFVCWFLVDYNLFNRVSRSYIKGSHSNPHQWKSNTGGKQKIVTLKHLNLAKFCVLGTHCLIMVLCLAVSVIEWINISGWCCPIQSRLFGQLTWAGKSIVSIIYWKYCIVGIICSPGWEEKGRHGVGLSQA